MTKTIDHNFPDDIDSTERQILDRILSEALRDGGLVQIIDYIDENDGEVGPMTKDRAQIQASMGKTPRQAIRVFDSDKRRQGDVLIEYGHGEEIIRNTMVHRHKRDEFDRRFAYIDTRPDLEPHLAPATIKHLAFDADKSGTVSQALLGPVRESARLQARTEMDPPLPLFGEDRDPEIGISTLEAWQAKRIAELDEQRFDEIAYLIRMSIEANGGMDLLHDLHTAWRLIVSAERMTVRGPQPSKITDI